MPGKQKILIIEDDVSIAGLEKDYLEANGFEADVCGTGTVGLEMARSGQYDLILLDLMLPGLDGLDILRLVRGHTDVPILIVSARTEENDKIRGLSVGADDYITKPFSPGELVARIKSHLGKIERIKSKYEPQPESRFLTVGGLEIRLASRRVYVNGQEINLTQKEYDLLIFMVRNPDRVFSKEELFERIWGLDATGDTATVTVHIARLRDKLVRNPEQSQYIETVWGAGYRFRA